MCLFVNADRGGAHLVSGVTTGSRLPAKHRLARRADFIKPFDARGVRRGLYDFRRGRGFFRDAFHRIDEQVAFFLRFRFCRLNHQGAGYDQWKCRGVWMKAIVDQALSDVGRIHSIAFLYRVAEYNFMHRGQGIRQIVNALEMLANIIRVEYRIFRRLPNAGSVGQNVGERANQHAEVPTECANFSDRIRPYLFERQLSAVAFDQNRRRTEGLQNFLHGHRTCAWTAASMRSTEGFVQVQMHHVHAQIAGPSDAGQRVHIRAVHVEQRAFAVQNGGNFRHAVFEDSQRGGVSDHQRSDIFGYQFAQFVDINLAMGFGFDVLNFVAGNHRGGGIRAVRGVWYQNFFARIALFFEVSPNQQQAGQFALCARSRLQSDRVHSGNFQKAVLQELQNLQAALREFLWLVGMLSCNSVEPRDKFIYARIVFHGAGAQWIHSQVDGVIPGGKPREMANHFDFADFRKAFHLELRHRPG